MNCVTGVSALWPDAQLSGFILEVNGELKDWGQREDSEEVQTFIGTESTLLGRVVSLMPEDHQVVSELVLG